MNPHIEILAPVIVVKPIRCTVRDCAHMHERVVNLDQFEPDNYLSLCRKHYEDFVASAHTLP